LDDWTIENDLILDLSWDIFVGGITWLVSLSNIPSGLTGVVKFVSWTQLKISLTWTANNHVNSDDVVDLWISFLTGAFEINSVSTVTNSVRNNIEIDFYDPFSSISLYPNADTLLDADTEPANGCDDWNCQEANYGALTYMWASDFGSVSLIKFDLSQIPAWSQIYSATIRLTRYDIWTDGTWFKLKKIINNPWWIEWVGNGAGSNADKALVGEPNYKQCKWTQTNWNNGEPWLVSNSDYSNWNLIDDLWFSTSGGWDETKTFQLNLDWVNALQSWLDNSWDNQWFAFLDANQDWTIIHSREASSSNRPYLSINYNADYISPVVESLTPIDWETWVVLDTNLFIEFSEFVYATGNYDIFVKKSSDDSIFDTISSVWSQVDSSWTIIKISLSGLLEANTWYYVQIESGAFVDRAGNAFTGILDTITWDFFTIDSDNVPVVTWATSSWVTQNTGVLWWEIISTWSAIIIERWIYWDLIDGFNPVDGMKVSEVWSWNTIGSFSVPVSWLPAGLWIYYRAFAINSYGNWFSEQKSFLTKPNNPVAKSGSNISNHSFVSNWDNVTWADSYQLYVSTNSGFTSFVAGYWPKLWIVWNSELIENLEVETDYYYKVVAKNSAGLSFDSNVVSVSTTLLPFPIMHLKLEESVGNVAYDSANTHDAILDWWILMQETWIDNKAFYLDGSDDKLTVVDFGYGPDFTISVWFKKSANIGTDYLFSHGADSDNNSLNVYFDSSSSSLKTLINWSGLFEIDGSDYTDLLDDEWHLYTLAVDDNYVAGWKKKVVLYIDWEQVDLDQTTLIAWSYNPIPNITIGRRSIDTAWTYFEWTLDDVRMYNQMLRSSEVQELYDNFVTDLQAPYVSSINPLSWSVDIAMDADVEIIFSKDVNKTSVENTGVISFSPLITGLTYTWSDDKTVHIGHNDFDYETEYQITINTWVEDLSWVLMEADYISRFTTMKNIYLIYDPTVLLESEANDGSIQNDIVIVLTWDTFSSGVVSSWYVVATNIPNGLTGVFVRDSDNQVTFSLSGNAVEHWNADDINNLSVMFSDDAFVVNNAWDVSRSTKNNLYIDFNDPDFVAIFPMADTTLDINNKDYNYGESTELFVGDWSFMLLKFDLSNFPVWAIINSATLTLRKINGAGSDFEVGKMINNADWEEWLKLWSIANNWESVYNQRKYNQENWSGGVSGLMSWTDYDATHLVDNPWFSGNESRIFSLNSIGLSVLSWWINDASSNEWFVLFGGNDKFILWASENWTESYRPKLLINYTPDPHPYNGPITIWSFTGFDFSTWLSVENYEQSLEENMGDYFWVDDPNGYNSGYYTTISVTDLTWENGIVDATNIYLQATGVDLLSGTANSNVVVNSALSSFQEISSPVTLIKRDTGENNYKKWKYGVKPKLKVVVPAFQSAWDYSWIMTYTLYEL